MCCLWGNMADEKTESKLGRTPAWEEIIQPRMKDIIGWLESGMIDEDVCVMLGIHAATWYRIKGEQDEFREAVSRAKHIPNRKVTNALFERCLGVEYDETTQEPLLSTILSSLKGEDRESVEAMIKKLPKAVRDALVTTKVVRKLIPADVPAIKFWLMNRERKIWAKSGDEFSGNITVNLPGMYGEKGDIPPPTDGKELAGTAGPEDSGE